MTKFAPFLLFCSFSSAFGLLGCGSDEAESNPWAGNTYLLQVAQNNWFKPRALANDSLVNDIVPDFLIGVAAGSNGALKVTLATSNGTQDLCNPTTEVSASNANQPKSLIAADAFPMRMSQPDASVFANATIRDFSLTDILPGVSPAKSGSLSAEVDVRDVYTLFTLIPDASKDSVCASLAQVGAPCAPCSSDGEAYCLTLEAVDLEAQRVPQSIVPIASGQLDSSCDL